MYISQRSLKIKLKQDIKAIQEVLCIFHLTTFIETINKHVKTKNVLRKACKSNFVLSNSSGTKNRI